MPAVDPRIEIHDATTHALIDVLEHAYQIGYDLQANASPTGSFMLPRDDPKWSAVAPFREAWMYDGVGDLVDVFRIAPVQERDEAAGTVGLVKLEGYANVLQDDLIPAELIFTNVSVVGILTALLSYQTVARVSLGTVDAALDKLVTTRASYVNVMRACWEVRNIVGGFISVDAVSTDPTQRRLNLRADPGQDVGQRVTQGFNLRSIAKSTETQAIVTKVWPLGRGEGPSQQRPSTDKISAQAATFAAGGAGRSTLVLTDAYSRYKGWIATGAALPTGADAGDTRTRPLKVLFGATDDTANWEQGANERTLRSKVNGYAPPAGAATIDYVHADYLIADDSVGTYGTIGNAMVDKNLENSLALIRTARTYLDGVKTARVSHDVSVHDLARIYPDVAFERLHLHDKVNVIDADLGVVTKDRIVTARYGDLNDPTTFSIGVTNVELAELAGRVATLSDKVRKYENQPDGATTMLGPDSFEDNLDPTHPYVRNIEIPTEAITVMSVKLRMRTKAYRYYVSAGSSSAASGGHIHNLNFAATVTGTTSAHNHAIANEAQSFTNSEVPAHVHVITTTLTPGIVETTTPSAMTVLVDGNAIPGTAVSLDGFDLTPYLSRDANGSIVRGIHTVTFTPNTNGRIQATLTGLVYLQSRGVIAG